MRAPPYQRSPIVGVSKTLLCLSPSLPPPAGRTRHCSSEVFYMATSISLLRRQTTTFCSRCNRTAISFFYNQSRVLWNSGTEGGGANCQAMAKNKSGHHGHANKIEVLDVVRQMASHYPDEQIAATLNRLGLRTGWNKFVAGELNPANFEPSRAGSIVFAIATCEKRHVV
jgi:hypothetical protein